jgi:hypothetical protein
MKRVLRGVFAVAVVVALALPAAAEPAREGVRRDVVKAIKTWFAHVLGDGLVDPRP